MATGVAVPPDALAVDRGAGDTTLPFEVTEGVNGGDCAVPPTGLAPGAGAGVH